MANDPKKAVKTSQTNPNEQLERMAAFNGVAMAVFTQACQAYATGLATLNGELMSFVNTRLQHDADLGRALATCDNWSEATDLQQDWARKASEEYLAEAGTLMEVASKVAKESWEPVSERADKALEELRKATV